MGSEGNVTDLLVIGGGVFGLTVARAARQAGMSVRVIEAARPGAGASGGPVGALTPHAPTRWRPMMAFQFQALLSLSGIADPAKGLIVTAVEADAAL